MSDSSDQFFKFKIGEEVKVKGCVDDNTKAMILERGLQECDGGIQIFYKVRPFTLQTSMFSVDKGWGYSQAEFKMREMELEKLDLSCTSNWPTAESEEGS